jgi:large subunit ribosomal protein L2
MSIKRYKPVTPTLRNRISINYKEDSILSVRPVKKLVTRKKNNAGRNNKGRISSFHRGGGHKRLYRQVDFKREIQDIEGYIVRNEYDPNRSSYISLVAFTNGKFCYMLTPQGLKQGDRITSSLTLELPITIGNSLPLKNVPVGTLISNIELKPGKGGQLIRSAGCSAKIVRKDNKTCLIRLNSGRQMELSSNCFCTIGIVSNIDYSNVKLGKAGRTRWLNIKPTVRGVVMNPVDHPHGGGEGKTSGGRCSVTPWGIPTKGYKTNRKKKNKTLR